MSGEVSLVMTCLVGRMFKWTVVVQVSSQDAHTYIRTVNTHTNAYRRTLDSLMGRNYCSAIR